MRVDSLYTPAEADLSAVRLARQMERLGKVLATTSAPAARAAAEQAGLLDGTPTLDRLRRVPLLRKEFLPKIQVEAPMLGGWVSADRAHKFFASPGPIHEPEGEGPDYWGTAPALHAAGFRRGDVVLNSYSYHLGPAGSMLEGGLLALGASVIPGGVGNTELQVRTASQLRATGYVGTPSFLAAVLEKADELGLSLAIEMAGVSGEPLPESLRQRFESRGIRTQQTYAIGDVGTIAYECPRKDGLHLVDRCIVELVDPETHAPVVPEQPGEVVVTLLDPTYPLLRLATGDLSVLTEEPCPCGRIALRLRRILGRVGEAVKVRGIFVHPFQLRAAMARLPQALRCQFAVRREQDHDEFVARVEADRADPVVAGRLQEAVRDATRLRTTVEFVTPGSVPQEAKLLVDERSWE